MVNASQSHIPPLGTSHRQAFAKLAVLACAFFFAFSLSAKCTDGQWKNAQPSHDESPQPLTAERVMEKVFYYAERNFLTDLQYQADVYLRKNVTSKRRGLIARYFPWMSGIKQGEHQQLTECSLQLQFNPMGQRDCKVNAYCSTAEGLPVGVTDEVENFNFFLYDTNLFTDRILNPLNRRNKRFYRYELRYVTRLDSFSVAHIALVPRFENEQLLKDGSVEVDLNNGAVRKFTFRIFSQMRHVVVTGQTGTGYYESVFPSKMRILTRFKFLGNRLDEAYDVYANYRFSCPLKFESDANRKHDVTEKCLLRLDTMHAIRSREYFDAFRPFPLRGDERLLYEHADVQELKARTAPFVAKEHEVLTDSLKATTMRGEWKSFYALPKNTTTANVGEWTKDMLLSSHTIQFGTAVDAKVRFPAVFTPSMVQWSHSKGVSVKTRLSMSANFRAIDAQLSFHPQVGYSFKQRQVYWDVPLQFVFWPRMNAAFTINAGGGQHMYSSRQADEVRHKLKNYEKRDSILHIIDHFGFDDYRDLHLKADFAFSPHPSFRVVMGLHCHQRKMIDWNETAANAGMHRTLGSVAPHFEAEWTPGLFYYRKGVRRIPLYSRFPTFHFNYERAFGTTSAETRYERLETDIRYRLSLYALRSLCFRAGFGTYLKRGENSFIDYDLFRFHNIPEGWNDEMSGEFQLLSSRWYNESSYYVRLSSAYESPMLLFARIPWITHFVRTEHVYCNLLSVKYLNWYAELGYGVSTNLVNLGVFASATRGAHFGVGFKCAIRLFED